MSTPLKFQLAGMVTVYAVVLFIVVSGTLTSFVPPVDALAADNGPLPLHPKIVSAATIAASLATFTRRLFFISDMLQ